MKKKSVFVGVITAVICLLFAGCASTAGWNSDIIGTWSSMEEEVEIVISDGLWVQTSPEPLNGKYWRNRNEGLLTSLYANGEEEPIGHVTLIGKTLVFNMSIGGHDYSVNLTKGKLKKDSSKE